MTLNGHPLAVIAFLLKARVIVLAHLFFPFVNRSGMSHPRGSYWIFPISDRKQAAIDFLSSNHSIAYQRERVPPVPFPEYQSSEVNWLTSSPSLVFSHLH